MREVWKVEKWLQKVEILRISLKKKFSKGTMLYYIEIAEPVWRFKDYKLPCII